MDVEDQGRKDQSVAGEGEVKEVWKTVQRVRRPRRVDGTTPMHNTGSRFTVLREDVEQEIDGGTGNQREANVETDRATGHTAKAKSQSYQYKNVKQSDSKKAPVRERNIGPTRD
ncbi:hypothetical protein K1719_045856 [Acacia pycnantha]|nr:hypothetical protein K1719_045856 [Acacia pycnantha]